jgi:CRISPR-associated endonuclease Cas1
MAATTSARKLEKRRDWDAPQRPLRPRGKVIVADGFGVSVRVERGQLLITDGTGRERRQRRFGRATSEIQRLVVIGGSGSVTLDAIRWLADTGAALVCVDRDGSVLCSSLPGRADAKLRRAQALAPFNQSGLAVARALLQPKLEGQLQLLERLPGASDAAERSIREAIDQVASASTIEDAMIGEANAARAYWGCWANVEPRFRIKGKDPVPAEWRRFGPRESVVSRGTRLAATPAAAMANYLFALATFEAHLACLSAGLDPAIAVLHADRRYRDSLPLDLVEPIRPAVEEHLLDLLETRELDPAWFFETRRGSCRLLRPLTHELAATLPRWRSELLPVASRVSRLLTDTPEPAVAVAQGTPAHPAGTRSKRPRTEPRCGRCGGPVPRRSRSYCDPCLKIVTRERYDKWIAKGKEARRNATNDPSQTPEAKARRGAAMTRRHRERFEWTAVADEKGVFEREILPRLQGIPLAELQRATGLSHTYVSAIRRGKYVPHPQHWPAFRRLAERDLVAQELRI